MDINNFNKILVIINTTRNGYIKVKNLIEKKLNSILYKSNYIIKFTEDSNSMTKFSKKFVEKNKNSLIIIVGGDGSLNEVVNSVVNSDATISLIPFGTGNDFSRSIYGTKNYNKIIKNITKEVKINKIDLLKINDLYCINVFSFGYDSMVLNKSLEIKEKLPILRNQSFILGILTTLNKLSSIKYNYKFNLKNGENLSGLGDFLITAICNASHFGGGFNPAPNAKIDDGILNFNAIEYIPIYRLIYLLRLYKTDKHLNLNISHSNEIISGKIESIDDKIIIGNIDGNIYKFKELNFEIIEKAINFIYLI